MCQFRWGCKYGPATNPYNSIRPRLAEPGNTHVWQTSMPVVDHKPVGQDFDDEHHHKLVDMQQKNNNDASPVFEFIPIGSTVVVQ